MGITGTTPKYGATRNRRALIARNLALATSPLFDSGLTTTSPISSDDDGRSTVTSKPGDHHEGRYPRPTVRCFSATAPSERKIGVRSNAGSASSIDLLYGYPWIW